MKDGARKETRRSVHPVASRSQNTFPVKRVTEREKSSATA